MEEKSEELFSYSSAPSLRSTTMAALLRLLKKDFSPPHRGLMARSAILWGLGDVGAQAVTHYSTKDKDEEFVSFGKKHNKFKINWYRVCTTSFFGAFSCIGPAAYHRCTRMLPSSTTTTEFVIKTPWDGLFGTLNLATFFPWMNMMQGRDPTKEDVKRGFKPAVVLGGAVLPAALITNWCYVPVPYRLHCASLFALVGSCYLSWSDLEQHKDGTRRIRKMERVRVDPTSVRSG